MTSNIQELDRFMLEQIEFIDETIARTRADELTDVTALNENVNKICAAAEKIDDSEDKLIERRMAEMIGKLEELAQELQAFQDRTEEKPGDGTH